MRGDAYSIQNGLRHLWRAAALLLVLGGSGCATLPPNAGQDPRDPWEKVNRNVFAFNEGLDAAVLKPVAELYAKLPDGLRECFSNAFSNLRGPSTAINNALQGKPEESVSDVGRFLVNTTFGLAGCFDPATDLGLARHREDFGQTLGVWGFGPGPFVMLPVLGPSSVRDAVGILAVEPFLDLNFYIDYPGVEYSILALRIVNERAELLPADRLISEAALDKYSFIRDGYLQRRRSLVYDGNPPREPEPEDEDEPDAGPQKPPAAPSITDPAEKASAKSESDVSPSTDPSVKLP
jgi:phospholipid-binding lipoprotein MlaA